MSETSTTLLGSDEAHPVTVRNPKGSSSLLIVADHAGNKIPTKLGRLGVSESECRRHIAWDLGIAALSQQLSDALDATLVQQNYSRLVIDCNRPPGSETSIPEISELTAIPGNVGLGGHSKAIREREIFQPYHDRIAADLDRRRQAVQPAALIAMHSFTSVFKGNTRPWHAAVLYNRDPRLAHALMALLKQESELIIGDNEPYSVSDATDYTIPVHGEQRGLHHVAIEIRQDLIDDARGQQAWSRLLSRLLPQAYRQVAAANGAVP